MDCVPLHPYHDLLVGTIRKVVLLPRALRLRGVVSHPGSDVAEESFASVPVTGTLPTLLLCTSVPCLWVGRGPATSAPKAVPGPAGKLLQGRLIPVQPIRRARVRTCGQGRGGGGCGPPASAPSRVQQHLQESPRARSGAWAASLLSRGCSWRLLCILHLLITAEVRAPLEASLQRCPESLSYRSGQTPTLAL